jgi:hypothetical protein
MLYATDQSLRLSFMIVFAGKGADIPRFLFHKSKQNVNKILNKNFSDSKNYI